MLMPAAIDAIIATSYCFARVRAPPRRFFLAGGPLALAPAHPTFRPPPPQPPLRVAFLAGGPNSGATGGGTARCFFAPPGCPLKTRIKQALSKKRKKNVLYCPVALAPEWSVGRGAQYSPWIKTGLCRSNGLSSRIWRWRSLPGPPSHPPSPWGLCGVAGGVMGPRTPPPGPVPCRGR